jgi:hypothetical protein
MTAIDWLFQEILIRALATKELRKCFKQAKKMEKQQIINARISGDIFRDTLKAEQYYEQTFNQPKQ